MLDTFHAQECTKLLWAMGKGGVRCAALEAAVRALPAILYIYIMYFILEAVRALPANTAE